MQWCSYSQTKDARWIRKRERLAQHRLKYLMPEEADRGMGRNVLNTDIVTLINTWFCTRTLILFFLLLRRKMVVNLGRRNRDKICKKRDSYLLAASDSNNMKLSTWTVCISAPKGVIGPTVTQKAKFSKHEY